MAEAIAALAFAGNIVQFLEFGAKFAVKVEQIVKAGSSSVSDLKDLRHITEYLQPLLKHLNADDSSNQVPTKSPSQARLVDLSKECSRLVEELRQTLDDVKINDSGRRRDAIVTSFRLTWNHSKIEKLHQQIDKLRGQLAVELLLSIREHSSQSLQTQEAILQQLKAGVGPHCSPLKSSEQNPHGFVDDLGDTPGSIMLQYIRSKLESDVENEQMTKTEEDIHNLLFQRRNPVYGDSDAAQNYPRIEMRDSRRAKIETMIISSLRYAQIADRETSIAKAHRETFRWIFEDSPPGRKDTKFREWLESSDRLYWITGKAGSGKSTLMKYISNFNDICEGSLRCKEHLQKWADGKDRLVIASFYFWGSGSSIEASQQGLFRSLLSQILDKHPYLLPQITPKIWEAWSSFGLTVNIEREKSIDQILLSAIRELVERWNKKVCLFVDGLDEYQGDHEKLIATFRSFLLLPNVKICVSSRPLIVFEDSFDKEPSLMVQDFTYPDIEHFVTTRFNENSGFARLQRRQPDYAKTLITNIIDKASGVFLWIKLVVASLMAGLTNDDRISDLQRRLDLLPPDLEKLYDVILESLDSFYFSHASQYFKLLEACNNSPDALLYSFIDDGGLDFALKLPIQAFTQTEIQFRRDTVKRRLNSRCKGLLEVGPHEKIRFLHRSVKDYIDTRDVRLRIDGAVHKDFDGPLQLCSANLAMVKIISDGSGHERVIFAEECLTMAEKVTQNVPKMVSILDDLDRTLITVLNPDTLQSFYQSLPVNYDDIIRRVTRHPVGSSFLAKTVRFSVVNYVRARAKTGCMAVDDTRDHDDKVIRSAEPRSKSKKLRLRDLMRKSKLLTPSQPVETSGRLKGTWPLLFDCAFGQPISWKMCKCLLELGADPNLICRHDGRTEVSPWTQASPWTEMLAVMISRVFADKDMDADGTRVWKQWLPILALYMEYGASRDDSVIEIAWSTARSRDASNSNPHLSRGFIERMLENIAEGSADSYLEYVKI